MPEASTERSLNIDKKTEIVHLKGGRVRFSLGTRVDTRIESITGAIIIEILKQEHEAGAIPIDDIAENAFKVPMIIEFNKPEELDALEELIKKAKAGALKPGPRYKF